MEPLVMFQHTLSKFCFVVCFFGGVEGVGSLKLSILIFHCMTDYREEPLFNH